ncbi:kinase-like domain-containing protein [Mycena albidolilacea]|uniref:Kinase-like domain-containing protein n=1 Tax=Mycena albidolilacea TaxID=1033008 RepID=A0AAD6ZAT8_9AGAR|nr:kinase-like domain-containing protein [Mycena albidolilacea]
MLGWNNPCVVVERDSEILSSKFNTPMKMHSECHESCIEGDGDTVLPVFGRGGGGHRIGSPADTPFLLSAGPSPSSIERCLPQEHSSLPGSNLRPSRKQGKHAERSAALKSNTVTYAATPCNKSLEPAIPKLIGVALEDESPNGIETCFGDPLLPDVDSRLRGLTQLDRFPLASGANSDIYHANLIGSDGRNALVAMKMLHIRDPSEAESFITRLNTEVRIWRKLKHRNILPFLGAYDIDAPFPVLLSPFCQFGHIEIYLRHHPAANRDQLMYGVAFGLRYLHENNVVHGDLTLQNILVDKQHVACISDFGISRVMGEAGLSMYRMGSTKHIAPELFSVLARDGEDTTPAPATTSSDVYAFGFAALEILAGRPSTEKMGGPFVNREELDDLRPNRADYVVTSSISRELWFLLDRCWAADFLLRPTMAEILASPAFGVTQDKDSSAVPRLTLKPFSKDDCDGEEIGFGDPCLRSLPEASQHPRWTGQRYKSPLATGRYGDIFGANLDLQDGRKVQVVIKTLRAGEDRNRVQEVIKRLTREVHVWRRLSHCNVLPFFGLCDIGSAIPSLVSPFCRYRHVVEYLKNRPDANRNHLIHGVATGLKYLHDLDLVHGNLKAQNVLVDKRGVACISEFGIFKILDECDLLSHPPTGHMAPELSRSHDDHKHISPTKMSDMYSFALVALEILTAERLGAKPAPRESFTRPTRAQYAIEIVSPSMWTVIAQCWLADPQLRPTIAETLDSPPFRELRR